jgi:type IV secretory pathway TrbD component
MIQCSVALSHALNQTILCKGMSNRYFVLLTALIIMTLGLTLTVVDKNFFGRVNWITSSEEGECDRDE